MYTSNHCCEHGALWTFMSYINRNSIRIYHRNTQTRAHGVYSEHRKRTLGVIYQVNRGQAQSIPEFYTRKYVINVNIFYFFVICFIRTGVNKNNRYKLFTINNKICTKL